MSNQGLAKAFSRPAIGEKVRPRTDDERWFRVPGDIRGLHMVGRTNPRLPPLVTSYEIERLAEIWPPKLLRDYPPGWDALSRSQRMDLIATEILRQDREREGHHGAFADRREILMTWQWYWRTSHEIPMTEEQMIAILREERCRLYRGPTQENGVMREEALQKNRVKNRARYAARKQRTT